MVDFTLEIDGQAATVDGLGDEINGFTAVHVNNHSASHHLPTHIIKHGAPYKSISFRVNGCNYKVTR